ncbi:PPOX class F420-dependent oxidoreductase [Agromyces agglutinans]|nr:PPOX class F420-dependent oxidoreductase [Agromyces agglutinans]
MSTAQSRFRRIQSAIFTRIRHPEAATVSETGAIAWDASLLRGRHGVLVTYRADGSSVPTPVWYAAHGDRVFVRTGAEAYKVKRILRTPAVLLASSTGRGKPTGAPMRGRARILDPSEESIAERALRARHGLLRWVYSGAIDDHVPTVYIEVGPR